MKIKIILAINERERGTNVKFKMKKKEENKLCSMKVNQIKLIGKIGVEMFTI